MKNNDLATLWIILKELRDNAQCPLLRVSIDLAMLAISEQREIKDSEKDDD